jgi:hypothetical protein
VPDVVTLTEPQQGLEFGVDDDGQIAMRTLTSGHVVERGFVTVLHDESQPQASPAMRGSGHRVLNVSSDPAPPSTTPTAPVDLVELIARALDTAPSAIGPALFAVQMVKGPEQLRFSLTPEKAS